MLFDERKNPFHLMLRDLFNSGGLDAFFKAFETLKTECSNEQQSDELTIPSNPQAEFLDSWLTLLERLVNPKMILDTPHTMAPKSTTMLGYAPFDPIQYLIYVHKRAFESIDHLWMMHSRKHFSDQTSDLILNILCHLLKGETIITEHLKKEHDNASLTTGSNQTVQSNTNSNNSQSRPEYPVINQDHLQQLMDMGFAREAVLDALMQCQTIEQATEFLLTTPQSSYAANWSSRTGEASTNQDVDMVAAEESSEPKPSQAQQKPQSSQSKREEPLSKMRIDSFTDNILPGSLRLMDELPSTVYRVCDLILTVAQRNGDSWCKSLLTQLLADITDNVKSLLSMAEPLRAHDKTSFNEWTSQLSNASEANKVAVRVHLYSLLFDEMKIICADLMHKNNVIDCLVSLLEVGLDLFSLGKDGIDNQGYEQSTMTTQAPRWLAPTVLLIDLYEKGAIASYRRAPLLNSRQRTWLFFDERTGRWTPHMPSNNKIIDNAYKNGDQYVRYSVGRKHYLAQFSSMLQINEDTSNLRPIMMQLSPLQTEVESESEKLIPIVPRLGEHHAKTLIRVSVGFMQLPIDPNSLQAVMRLSFRLTRNYELAVLFAEMGGVRALQSLPESSQFSGFVSLATLIIRHVLEEPTVLNQTMEKVIRSTTQHCQHNQREMHYLLRVLGAPACRDEEIFKKMTTEILRIIPSSSRHDDEETRTKTDVPQLIKLLPPKPSQEPIKPSQVTRSVIVDLLDSLTVPIQAKSYDSINPTRFNRSPASPMPAKLLSTDPSLMHRTHPHRSSSSKNQSSENEKQSIHDSKGNNKVHNPLLNHSIVLRLLAELTRSYSVVPRIIVDHTYTPSTNQSINEDTSALSFILDNILPTTQTHSDRDGPPLARVFLAALAACNHCVEAQVAVVNEVKASLGRASSMPESCEKHARLQSLAGIVGTMIDCCPPVTPQQTNPRQANASAQQQQQQQQLSNNIVRLFVRKGLVTDLARIPHLLDLSAPHMFATVNAILKPLETLSRFVNLPSQSKQLKDAVATVQKAFAESSSSSSSGEGEDEDAAEANTEDVAGLDEREEDADDDEDDDDDDDDDEDDDHVDDDDDHVDDDEDHVDDDEDHVDDDEDHVEDEGADEDENLNAFGESQFAEDYPISNGQLNNVLNDIEEVFLQQSNIYSERLNTVAIPGLYDGPIDQHESSAPVLPPPPGNIGLTHPLLHRRMDNVQSHGPIQPVGAPPVIGRSHRYGRPRLLRGTPGIGSSQWHARHPSQTILQQLLGPSTVQEVFTLTSQFAGPGRFFVTDFHNWLATDDELYNDHTDSHTIASPHATALASIPLVMARWTEESRILDGGTQHDCLANIKQSIVATLEKFEEEENQERHEKRKKIHGDEEQTQPKKCKEPVATQVSMDRTNEQPPPSQPDAEIVMQEQSQDLSQASGHEQSEGAQTQDQMLTSREDSVEQPLQEESTQTHPEPELTEQSGLTPTVDESTTEPSEEQSESEQPQQSSTSEPAVVETETIPDGVDPSFLAALPEDIRREVLAEQWRLRRLEQANAARQAASTAAPAASTNEQASTSSGATAFPEVNPEFLAALPAEVQEEVLAQQRAEQQRQAASTTNPDQPVDPAIFIQTLAPNLRRQVLADMDDSLLSLLPQDLATEAMLLRREYLTSNASANSTLSRILRTAAAGHRIQRARYTIAVPDHIHNQSSWTMANNWPLDRPAPHGSNSSRNLLALSRDGRIKGRQLLDCEALTCLTILLFVQDQRLNIARLHRVLRNLSYHQQTRNWIVQSMLSIIERSRFDDSIRSIGYNDSMRASDQKALMAPAETSKITHTASWLSISMDAALGCRTSVFTIPRSNDQSNYSSLVEGRSINIHPQAAPTVCRHMLETLIALAKSFPYHFFPDGLQASDDSTTESDASSNLSPNFFEILAKLDVLLANNNKKVRSGKHGSTSTPVAPSACSQSDDATEANSISPLARLMGFLTHPIIKRSPTLTDRLLHLLAVISMAFPVPPDCHGYEQTWTNLHPTRNASGQYARRSNVANHMYYGRQVAYRTGHPGPAVSSNAASRSMPQDNLNPVVQKPVARRTASRPSEQKSKQPLVTKPYLKLAVDVLTSKSCSEEGLDDVTSLLSRLSRSCKYTRATVLELLMEGARQLGHNVCQHISTLKRELRDYNQKMRDKQAGPSTEGISPSAKGVVQDRFTNDSVIITARTSSKGGREVQLPSMTSLTSKNSSQSFFLRLLKVIIQLRDTAHTKTQPSSTSAASVTPATVRSGAQQQQRPTTEAVQEPPTSDPTGGASDMDVDLANLQADVSSVESKSASPEDSSVKPDESLSIELQLDDLWDTLSECLLELADTPDHHAVLVLQPAVETFFLVHSPGYRGKTDYRESHNIERNNQTAHIDQDVAPISPSDNQQSNDQHHGSSSGLTHDTQKFLKFAETHRVVLNHILRQSTSPLSQGPFAVLVDHTRVLDFDVKRRYFRQELERLDEGIRRDDLGIHVRRDNVFEESFRELHRRSAEEWKNRFFVVFEEEEGQDAGGLLREWYTIISREIFNPMYALFTTSPGDRVTYMINSASHCNTNHLTYFKFVGRVIAKAIYDNKLLDCYFTRSFYKHILGKPVKYTDMESEDYSFYQGLVFLLEHDVKELGYELTFSVEVREFGVTEVRELKPNGSNIPVTEENKHEYVRLVCQEKMTGSIRKQLNAFLEGFYDIIPKRLISIFNEQELELLISGLPNIDIDDLKASTEYHKYLPNSLQIQWFWRALRSFDQADRAKLLQFVTGTSKVPLQGFASLEGMNGVQKFQIHRDERSTDRLPSAHTCFNQLDLPVYETYDKLRYMLLKAIQECSEGFGLA